MWPGYMDNIRILQPAMAGVHMIKCITFCLVLLLTFESQMPGVMQLANWFRLFVVYSDLIDSTSSTWQDTLLVL
jgi:hypothetical protein